MKLYWGIMLFCVPLHASNFSEGDLHWIQRKGRPPALDSKIGDAVLRGDGFYSGFPSPTVSESSSISEPALDSLSRKTGDADLSLLPGPVKFDCPYCKRSLNLFVGAQQCRLVQDSFERASCKCPRTAPTALQKVKNCCDRTALILGYTLPPLIVGVMWWAYHTPAQSCYNHYPY